MTMINFTWSYYGRGNRTLDLVDQSSKGFNNAARGAAISTPPGDPFKPPTGNTAN
jgi:hypothetical protein